MEGEELSVKERILSVTIDLIRQEKDIEKISMRRIADAAGVAVSMVNYHYQTKAHLIDRAVQTFVGSVIAGANAPPPQDTSSVAQGTNVQDSDIGKTKTRDSDATDHMRNHLSRAARFIVENPGISRVSILRDMYAPKSDDNTSQVFSTVYRQLRAIRDEQHDSKKNISSLELQLRAAVQVAAIQHLFLRSEVFQETTGLDFFNEDDREQIINMVVDTTTGRSSR